jgi:hypothetical protein
MKGWVATYSNRPTQANPSTRWGSDSRSTLESQGQSKDEAETVKRPPQRLSALSTAPAETPGS